jgi:hypothetical protein
VKDDDEDSEATPPPRPPRKDSPPHHSIFHVDHAILNLVASPEADQSEPTLKPPPENQPEQQPNPEPNSTTIVHRTDSTDETHHMHYYKNRK